MQAEADLATILESSSDFATAITITNPQGISNSQALNAQVGDIGQVIDADTGLAISGRLLHVAVRMSSLQCAGLGDPFPSGIADPDQKPWLVQFAPIVGVSMVFKIKETRPDRTVGILVMLCEFWEPMP